MRYRSIRYIYIAGILLFIGNLLSSCVVFLHVHNTTHFFLVNPLSRLSAAKDTECHRKRNENNVNISRASFFSPQSIFFHSTSCNKIVQDYEACAIEAAARLHPDTEINLLYTSAISRSTWSDHLDQLVKFDNFRLVGIHVQSYADGTKFEEFWKKGLIHSRLGNHKEIAEYIKFLTLHKFGGTVLQLDVIVNKPLDDLGVNWLVKNGDGLLATDAISIRRSSIGRNITANILRLLSDQILKGSINGSLALTQAVSDLCPGRDLSVKQVEPCYGFEIVEDMLFHPISRDNAHYFHQSGSFNRKAFAHRLWHSDRAGGVISHRSLYADLARTFCPSVFSKLNYDY
ncbi:PREDICTED: uncharacterized protein LOC106114144 [Papilio xuthus]|uniref:Uncharacterized protein LOC106114144 n=1 Tax=Papilio xuthus TaxID=66420 RepID=A0AAJ7E4R2_PAPXU|nr:PREDICTED: uncharacterized protein LOC106114144 [Papilio xuthus]